MSGICLTASLSLIPPVTRLPRARESCGSPHSTRVPDQPRGPSNCSALIDPLPLDVLQ